MNATYATPRPSTTISLACPWCDEPVSVEDAFVTTAVHCRSCATTIDVAPVSATSTDRSVAIAA